MPPLPPTKLLFPRNLIPSTQGLVNSFLITFKKIIKYFFLLLKRGQKRKIVPPPSNPSLLSSGDYEQSSFQAPEIFAVKGKVFDDIVTVSTKSTPPSSERTRPTRGKVSALQTKTTPTAFIAPIKLHSKPVPTASINNPFRYPSIQNEEVFQKNLQEAPSTVDSKKYKPEGPDTVYSYSTLKFSGDDDEKFFTSKKASNNNNSGFNKGKPPKRSPSTATFNLEQSFGGNGQTQFNSAVHHVVESNNGFRPSSQYQSPTAIAQVKRHPGKLFKSTEDEFKDSEFFDFSIRPRPGQAPGVTKFSSDLSVKSLALKPHKNKFDPPAPLQHGFKPSSSNPNNFKLKDIPNLHGSEIGHGIASPGQIKTFYDAAESERDER
jgi:hypothetical protein